MQKTFFLTFFITLLSLPSLAHKAHSHSEARVSLAFDGAQGLFEVELPATTLIDFEHRPRSSIQKIKLQKALDSLAESLSKILILEPLLKCVSTSPKTEVLYSGKKDSHSEFKLSAQIQCEKQPLPSSIKLKILTEFPKLQEVEVQTLLGDQQKSFILTGSKDTLN